MTSIWQEASRLGSLWLLLTVIITTVAMRVLRVEERRRTIVPIYLTMIHFVLLPVMVLISDRHQAYDEVRFGALLTEAMAFIGCAGGFLFGIILPRVGVHISGILRDVVMAIATLVAGVSIARRLDFSLHGIIATSAVVTGVIGFSLQDVLGNVMGGLSIQIENSLAVGDWVKIGDISGRVVEIRWRTTAIETRNGDTVLVPNAVITKTQVTVLGRSQTQSYKTRRWVWFNVDFRFQPTDVIVAVEHALAGVAIPGVAGDPKPSCVLMELGESYGRYAVRYWLTDFVRDDPTDSEIRTRVFFALSRAGIPLSMPAQQLFVTEDDDERRARKGAQEVDRRMRLVSQLELFSRLSAELREELVEKMRPAPFARGEEIHHQGAEAHYLYVLREGEIEERVQRDGMQEVVCRIEAPGIFGEMSLMTATPRAATVVALTDVECYRLDKAAFDRIMHQPEVAEHMARVLARRTLDFERAHKELDQEAARKQLQARETDILGRIRDLFGVSRPVSPERRAAS